MEYSIDPNAQIEALSEDHVNSGQIHSKLIRSRGHHATYAFIRKSLPAESILVRSTKIFNRKLNSLASKLWPPQRTAPTSWATLLPLLDFSHSSPPNRRQTSSVCLFGAASTSSSSLLGRGYSTFVNRQGHLNAITSALDWWYHVLTQDSIEFLSNSVN